jgi:hypothetical protein
MLNNTELEAARRQIAEQALTTDGKIIRYLRAAFVRVGNYTYKTTLRERKLYLWALEELVEAKYAELVTVERDREIYELTYPGILLAETKHKARAKAAAANYDAEAEVILA